MVIFSLALLGVCFGSFVNALVWRLRQQEQRAESREQSKKAKARRSRDSKLSPQPSVLSPSDLSILKGRSMCVDCHHTLSTKDLVPVFSWISLRGKCRYCKKPISWQYPLVELLTSGLFVVSYIWWPLEFDYRGITNFVVWCVLLVGFMALFVYDFRWMLLPNRIVYPITVLTGALALFNLVVFKGGVHGLGDLALSLVIASGFFYVLFQYSKGKWIGGGDVKLGIIIGLILAVPSQSFLALFLASLIGTFVMLPGLISKKLKSTTHIPFGPFLIIATIVVKLFGASVVTWYRKKFLLY